MICALCWSVSALLAPTVKAEEFPIIFYSPSELRQLGIAVDYGRHVPPLKNKCFYYGDGGYLISTSDEFYRSFKQRGFSIEAMCLGLISVTRYDPETGRRLPTYILADPKLIKERSLDPGTVTEELPLDLPDCFKNANPYSDCSFRFGRISGKKLSAAETDAFKRLGAAIDEAMKLKIRAIEPEEGFYGPDEPLVKGFRAYNGGSIPEWIGSDIPKELLRYSNASLWRRSTKFARGYGYALDAEGASGPDVNPDALRAATQGLLKPQIDPQRLRQILNPNRQ